MTALSFWQVTLAAASGGNGTWGTVLNYGIVAALGVMGWVVRRTVSTNDKEHDEIDERIGQLLGAVEAEREARHQSVDQLSDRVWGLNSDLKENYVTRREAMRQFGTLCQKVDGHHERLSKKIDALPCRTFSAKNACPSGASGAKT